MKILVTGGAGFIGSHVVDGYIAAGHEVIVIDNLNTGQEKNNNPRARFIKADIRSLELKAIISSIKPEVINHHAAHIHVGKSVNDPINDANVNILGFLNVVQAGIATTDLKKIIFASTGGAMYGDKQTPFNEGMKPQPLSPYGISKRAGELYLYFYMKQYGVPFVSLRYANVYGPRQNPYGEAGVIAIFCEALLTGKQPIINGDGRQTRDYVFVADVVKANQLVLTNNEIGEFNIGTGKETNVNEIYSLVQKALNSSVLAKHGPPRPGEQQTSSLDYSLAKEKLGWEPTTTLTDGIAKTALFFKQEFSSKV